MSYTRRFSKTITIPFSVNVPYPASQTGGTKHYSDTVTEEVVVEIEVDTDPFDSSVQDCAGTVDTLTGAVALTESAQVASIHANSRAVASTIIEGFFKTVRADLSSQIVELSQKVEARLMHLKQQADTLIAKQQELERSYQRMKARYIKIFDDLNTELENRIKNLDQPAFKMAESTKAEVDRMLTSEYPGMATQSQFENAMLQSQISAATANKRGLSAIKQILEFLRIQHTTDSVILHSAIQSMPAQDASCYLPVCYAETTLPQGGVARNCYFDTEQLDAANQQRFQNEVFQNGSRDAAYTEEKRSNIESYFSSQLNEDFAARTSEHDMRVKNLISKLFYSI